MKKYIQYNQSYYRDSQSDLRSNRPLPLDTSVPRNRIGALDLSGKQKTSTPGHTPKQQWTNDQETALDLSGYGKPEAQDVALDLSKPSIPKPESKTSSRHGNQTQRLVSTPPSSRHSRSPAGQQYSLLQAALNSTQPNAGLHQPFDAISQSTAGLHPAFDTISQSTSLLLQQRALNFSAAGMPVGDFSRAIKPFSTMSSRPLGFSMLQGTHPVGAVIQGAHKPIAITTPQPHNSSTDTKSQSVSNSTVSVTDANQSVQSTSNQGFAVGQPNYSSGHLTQANRTLNSGKLSGSDIKKHSVDSIKEHDEHVERYMIHPTDGLNHHITNMLPTSTHSLAGFSCNQCSKTFKTKAALKLHTTVHKTSEERQYGCTICNRRFLHRHHLVVHQRKHSGEKPFKCNACAKTFMAIFLLHKHLRKHARETGPVSQISMDQLKQLHDKKLISVGTESLPFLKSGPEKEEVPVIILDDDESVNATVEIKINDVGKFDRDGESKDKKILEIIGNNPKMILDKLKADLISKSKTKEVTSNQNSSDENAGKVFIENNDKIKTETEIQQGDPDNLEKTKGEDECDVKVEFDSSNNYNYILKDSEDEGKEIGSREDLNIGSNQLPKTENVETDDSFLQKYEETAKSNPIPEYGSDDEVELDCITGEITVVRKKKSPTEMNTIKANESKEKDTELKVISELSEGRDETVKEVIECLVKHAENVSDDVKLAENVDNKIMMLKDSDGDGSMKSEQNDEVIEVIPNENDQSEVFIKDNIANVKAEVTENVKHIDTDDSSICVGTDIVSDPDTKVNIESEMDVDNKSPKRDAEVMEISLEEKECVAIETENMTASGKFEGRNIFDKITAMKDMKDVKSCHAEKEYVEKEVDIILRNIKRVVCKDDEISVVEAKKPKLETEDVHSEIASKLKSEKDIKPKSDEIVVHSRVVGDNPQYTKGKKKGRKVKCEVCSRSFHSNHYLLLHMAVHKRSNPMLQSLKKAKDYQMKAMGFVNKSNVSCEVCKKVFKFQKSLNSHMRVHSEKLIQTKLYRKAFRDFMAEAAPQNSRICDKDKSLTMSGSENESQTRHCSEDDQESSSVATSISASEKSRLDNATIGELNEEPEDDPPIKVIVGSDNLKRYLCHACDNTYTTKQKLRMHALIHKDNCFLCEICGKSFFRQITLEKHISTHMLPRPHICDVCKKTFIHRSSLMRHKVAHEKTAAPGLKQQVADRNFEMKMLDTYSMLKQERLQKLKMQKEQEQPERMTMKMPNKYDALDLTVKIKTEDPGLPPVLSPVIACLPNSSHSIPWNLSPPLITQEGVSGRLSNDRTPEKVDSRRISESNSGDYEQANVIERVKSRTDSTCSESDTVTVEGHKVVQKRVRKTRVYPTSCRVCKEVFPNVMLLKSHMAIHNTVETHLYECHICRHRFTQSCSLLRHLKTSCQENKMKCIPCGRTFHRRNTFDQHMRLHQGGPPNLDGSFYDKRPDEVAVHEERESDIENNNLSKVQQAATTLKLNIAPLTIENVNLLNKNQPIITGDQDNGDDSDDARTYLYSEGEVHSRYNSDFSDNEWSPPHSPKKIVAPQDLSMSSANMTLNLLSAVCSDIRNAEKEKELKQKEFEEKQKELETIEILANLKRGAMQKSFQHASQIVDPAINPSTVPLSVHESNLLSMSHNSSNHHFSSNISSISSNLSPNNVTCISSDSIKYSVPSSGIGLIASSALASPLPNNQQKQLIGYSGLQQKKVPAVIEGNISSGSDPKIPTVVLEADAEHRRRAQAHRTWTGRSASVPTPGELNKSKDGSTTPDMPQMKFHYPAIHERLSLLMKAQISASATLASENTKSVQSSPSVSLPSISIANFIPHISPGRHLPSQTQSPMNVDTPQDLSVKRKSPAVTTVSSSNPSKTSVHSLLESTMISPTSTRISEKSPKSTVKEKHKSDIPRSIGSRSLPSDLGRLGQDDKKKAESSSAPPPLVPMFHCELCSRVLYSKTDLHLHMMEHGRSAGALYKMLHNNQVLTGKKASSQESPVDFTKPGPSISVGASTGDNKQTVPHSLDLPSKSDKIVDSLNQSVAGSQQDSPSSQLKTFMSSASKISENLSPVTSSDFSDSHSLPSPSTPSGPGTPTANLDMLRQELRLKIYARRRSQGLDDLKVEFKQPEPTEMTEAEKVKLLYRRECNRQAAQRSRMRKKDLVDSLLEELHTEEVVNSDLRRKMEALTAEKISLLKALNTHECVLSGCDFTAPLSFPSISRVASSDKLDKLADDEIVSSSQKKLFKQCFELKRPNVIELDGMKDKSVKEIKSDTVCEGELDGKSVELDVLHVLNTLKKGVIDNIKSEKECISSSDVVMPNDDLSVMKLLTDRKDLNAKSIPNTSVT